MSKKYNKKYDRMNRKGMECTIASLTCDFIGKRDYVKRNNNLNTAVTITGLGFNIASFTYYLRALGSLEGHENDENRAFMDHMMGSMVWPLISAVHLATSLRNNRFNERIKGLQ